MIKHYFYTTGTQRHIKNIVRVTEVTSQLFASMAVRQSKVATSAVRYLLRRLETVLSQTGYVLRIKMQTLPPEGAGL